MTTSTEVPSNIHDALLAVKETIGFIPKDDRNAQQGFNFRGVDAVVNKCGPAFLRHRINVSPMVEDISHEMFQTRSGTSMRNTTVRVRFRFFGPGGKEDYLDAVTAGEAADAGDKSVPKAQSVAYRVALLQVLTIPTEQPDPDSQSYERAAARETSGRDWLKEVDEQPTVELVQALWRECSGFGELTDAIRTAMTRRANQLDTDTTTTNQPETVGASA